MDGDDLPAVGQLHRAAVHAAEGRAMALAVFLVA